MKLKKRPPVPRRSILIHLPPYLVGQKIKLLVAVVGIFCTAQVLANVKTPSVTPEQEIDWVVEAVDGISRKRIHSGEFLSPQLLQGAYEINSYRPLWAEQLKDPAWLDDTLNALTDLRYDALPAARYQIKDVANLRHQGDKRWLLDMRLSDAIITAIKDLNGNLMPPEQLGRKWKLENQTVDPLVVLEQLKFGGSVSDTFDSLRPSHIQYERLRNTLKNLHQNTTQKPFVSEGKKLVLGDTGERVYALTQRLAAEDLLDGDQYDKRARFDESIAAAVKTFQQRHGLKVDGVVGKFTRAALNTSPDDITLQISLNLQRWRAAPKTFPSNHILVNTAGYKMELRENGEKALEMKVIVGKRDRQTPSFTEPMTQLVLNPKWNIPSRITREEILPKLRDDPDYAIQQGIRALIGNTHVPWTEIEYEEFWADEFPYRLQQAAGEKNALGRYKFLFPNPYMVYLHDTPYKNLFSTHKRAYSHGCVRLAEPEKLAYYLLAKKGWSEAKVRNTINRGKRKIIALQEPLPVFMMYLTSWVNDDGSLELYPDVYQQDKPLSPVLASILKTVEKDDSTLSVASIGQGKGD